MQNFTFPPFFFRTADGAVSKGGSLWFPFFRPFFVKRQRKGIFAFTERAQLCEAQGEVAESPTKSFTAFSFDAHTALRARSLCCLCLFFALPQRIGEEKALRGLPLRTPSACAVAGEINLAARRKSRQLQLLRLQVQKTCKHGSFTDFAFAKNDSFCLFLCDRRKLKRKRDSKSFCHANPSAWWDICHADGGVLLNFAFSPFFF